MRLCVLCWLVVGNCCLDFFRVGPIGLCGLWIQGGGGCRCLWFGCHQVLICGGLLRCRMISFHWLRWRGVLWCWGVLLVVAWMGWFCRVVMAVGVGLIIGSAWWCRKVSMCWIGVVVCFGVIEIHTICIWLRSWLGLDRWSWVWIQCRRVPWARSSSIVRMLLLRLWCMTEIVVCWGWCLSLFW